MVWLFWINPFTIFSVLIYDSLINGIKSRVEFVNATHATNPALFIQADIRDTAAVYASSETGIVKESDETNPISPYGESKLLAEKALNDFLDIPGNQGTSLRFFNVVGTACRELIDNSREN